MAATPDWVPPTDVSGAPEPFTVTRVEEPSRWRRLVGRFIHRVDRSRVVTYADGARWHGDNGESFVPISDTALEDGRVLAKLNPMDRGNP